MSKLRFELRRLQRELGVTTLYVTHDQFEALALSDQIAVMRDGHIEQLGTPREIYEKPANHFVANFIGSTNFIAGKIATESPGCSGRVPGTDRPRRHPLRSRRNTRRHRKCSDRSAA